MKALMIGAVALCFVLTLPGQPAGAGEETVTTTILVPGMDCGGCAKKLSTALSKVAAVAKVEADLEAKSLKVTPKDRSTVSPKALWEALENAGKAPQQTRGARRDLHGEAGPITPSNLGGGSVCVDPPLWKSVSVSICNKTARLEE